MPVTTIAPEAAGLTALPGGDVQVVDPDGNVEAWFSLSSALLLGHGSPEGVETANPSSGYRDVDSGLTYRKRTGTDEFGWQEIVDVSDLPSPVSPTPADGVFQVNDAATDWVAALLLDKNVDPSAAIKSRKLFGEQAISSNTLLVSGTSGAWCDVDTSGGAVTVTLPAAPSAGEVYIFNDATASWSGANSFTVNPNGKNIEGSASNVSVTSANGRIGLRYTGSQWLRWVSGLGGNAPVAPTGTAAAGTSETGSRRDHTHTQLIAVTFGIVGVIGSSATNAADVWMPVPWNMTVAKCKFTCKTGPAGAMVAQVVYSRDHGSTWSNVTGATATFSGGATTAVVSGLSVNQNEDDIYAVTLSTAGSAANMTVEVIGTTR